MIVAYSLFPPSEKSFQASLDSSVQPLMNGSSMTSERLKLLHSYSILDLGTGALLASAACVFDCRAQGYPGTQKLTEDIGRMCPAVPCQPPCDVGTQKGDMQRPQEPAEPASNLRRHRLLLLSQQGRGVRVALRFSIISNARSEAPDRNFRPFDFRCEEVSVAHSDDD